MGHNLMKHVVTTLLLVLGSSTLSAAEYFNSQFDRQDTSGIRIENTSLLPTTIYARFLIPGLDSKSLRNTGTKYTIGPKSAVTYYLPPGTDVVSTDGVYWDNPSPSTPEEKSVTSIQKNRIVTVPASEFDFD